MIGQAKAITQVVSGYLDGRLADGVRDLRDGVGNGLDDLDPDAGASAVQFQGEGECRDATADDAHVVIRRWGVDVVGGLRVLLRQPTPDSLRKSNAGFFAQLRHLRAHVHANPLPG